MSKAEDLAAMMVELTLHMDDVRAALVEQGADGVGAPTSAMGDLIRGLNPTPPVNVIAPVLSGAPEAGTLLTTTVGNWAGQVPMSYAIQWYREGAAVPGATALSYMTDPDDDVGTDWFARVTAINAVGSASADTSSITLGAFTGTFALASSTTVPASSTILASTGS